jgi:hypothetical protein
MQMKTDLLMSKQYAETHSSPLSNKVHKWATIWSYSLIAFMGVIFLIHLSAFTGRLSHSSGPNPHYGDDLGGADTKCNQCHDYPSDMCEKHDQKECMDCHEGDGLASRMKYRSILVLCTKCHEPDIYITYEHNGHTREVEVTRNHPYGLAMSPMTYPLSLPLRNGLAMTCITCHDVHDSDPTQKMLRLYEEAAVTPENVKPLCHDCHHSNGVL